MTDAINTSVPETTPESLRRHLEFFLPGFSEAVDALESYVDPLAFAFRVVNGPMQPEGDEAFDELLRETHVQEVQALCFRVEACIAVVTGDHSRFCDPAKAVAGIPDPEAVMRHFEREMSRLP